MCITLIGLGSFFSNDCSHHYNPDLYVSYDVLNPGPKVRENPLKALEDGTFVVNKEFLQWTFELKEEVKKLRKK